jgi:hypothetical protein
LVAGPHVQINLTILELFFGLGVFPRITHEVIELMYNPFFIITKDVLNCINLYVCIPFQVVNLSTDTCGLF